MGLRGWVKKKAKKAKKDLGRAGRKVERAAKDTGKAVKRTAKETERVAEKGVDWAEDRAEDVKDVAEDVWDDLTELAEEEIEKMVNKAIKQVEDAFAKKLPALADKAWEEVEEGLTKRVPALADKVWEQVEEGIVEKVPAAMEEAFAKQLPAAIQTFISDLVSQGIKPVLKGQAKMARAWADGMDTVSQRAPALIDEINNLGFEVELKVNVELTLEYANFWTRAREVAGLLDRYGNDGIELRRRDIRGFITALGPDSISFGGGASFSLGLDIGGVAKAKSISLALFIELADYIMEEMGVPE